MKCSSPQISAARVAHITGLGLLQLSEELRAGRLTATEVLLAAAVEAHRGTACLVEPILEAEVRHNKLIIINNSILRLKNYF